MEKVIMKVLAPMSLNWFKNYLIKIKKKAGPRYTPELNIDLPISEIFNGISRTETFYIEIREKYGEMLREFKYITSKFENVELQKNYSELKHEVGSLFKLIEKVKKYNTFRIPWETIHKQTKKLEDKLFQFADQLRKHSEQIKDTKTPATADGSYQLTPSEKLNSDIHHIYKTHELVQYFNELSSSTKANLTNHPFLLLTGSAGTGKTHLLCDLVEHRIENKKGILPAILIFGEYISNGKNFWKQVLGQMECEKDIKTKKDLLKKLNNYAKNSFCRTLFIIDALNENILTAPDFWKKNLDEISKDIKKYPNIAFVVSVRNGFENEVLTEDQKRSFIREEHHGFHFREWEATNKFFKTFGLPLPEIPVLMPEFQNPLFLLLFCIAFGIKNRDLSDKTRAQLDRIKPFRGHVGSTHIFEAFTKNSADRIANEFSLPKGRCKGEYVVWDTIIEKIAEQMVFQNDGKISEDKLLEIIQNKYQSIDNCKLVQSLEKNMLIEKIPKYENGERKNGFDIRFPFQKFSDHLIGRYIFKKYEDEFGKSNVNLKTARRFFSKRRMMGKFLSNSLNRGIIETLSIQCPERLKGIEFIEVAPFLKKNTYLSQIFKEAFIESMIWRNPKAFSNDIKNTLRIINEKIIKTQEGHELFLNALLSVAPIPGHPFNAEKLHSHLLKFTMPARDSWWSTFLHYQNGEHGAVDRLLHWAWSDQNFSHISDESILFSGIALAWFLTTPNRIVRDKATKGLVCLFQNRIHMLPKLLERFKNVNDLYVSERLFAVAYGCVLRNRGDINNLKNVAEWIYRNIFIYKKPPTHILLRDYARGVIEVALNSGIKLQINKTNIKPPYKSIWPNQIPTEEELKKKYYPEDNSQNKTKSREFSHIWLSVLGFGDFARYVIGTNSPSCMWSGRKLKKPELNRGKLFKIFKNQLTSKQKKLLGKATNPFFGISRLAFDMKIEIVDPGNRIKINEEKLKQKEIEEIKKKNELFIKFEKSLSNNQLIYFKKEIKPFLDEHGCINDPLKMFDLKIAQRWIFNRVIELGFDPKLHGNFDDSVNRYCNQGKSEHKAERIGKKYQWIAYHEFMALLSDHFEFKTDNWSDSIGNYKGPWNPFIRDIDSSFILQNDNHIRDSISISEWETREGGYDAWEKEKSDIEWIKKNTDLPNPKNLIQIDDDNKKKWVVLNGFVKWEEMTPPEYKKYDIPVREVWFIIKSYIVRKKDAKKFFKWAKKQNFSGRWMPESHDFYEIFLGEYPHSVAFEDLRASNNIWTKSGRGNHCLKIPVIVMDDSYLNEFTLDCSFSGSVSIQLPCKLIIDEMNLRHKYLDGRFYDKNDNLVTIDISIFKKNFLSALLINKQAVFEYLDKSGYSVFWTLLGEKQLIGGNHSRDSFVGRLEISGCFTFDIKGKIQGESNYKFCK